MTESEIKAYEEKAKTGILFMDRDLSSLYSALRSAVAPAAPTAPSSAPSASKPAMRTA
ncbi:hypothetical protein M5E87_02325 [Flavonifractor plautii]|nr:hypothetical protein M5E87_02325 [Flavonifractor plautii]